MEEANIDIGVDHTNYFSYSNKKYPFCLTFFSFFSNYFKDKKVKDNQVFPILDSTEQGDINLNDSSIINFLLFCHNKNYDIDNENAISLHYLAKKYNISILVNKAEIYIKDHYQELKAQLLSHNTINIPKHLIEESISNNLKAEINSNLNYLVHIPISSLYRILYKYFENHPTEKNDQEIIEFLFKVLKDRKKEASILFSLIDFSTRKTEYIDRLLSEFSNDFDFHFINPLFLKTIYEKENELILKEEEIESKINRTFGQIKSQQNNEVLSLESEVNQLRSQVSDLSQIVSEQKSQIENLTETIDSLILVCRNTLLNKGILFNLPNEVILKNGGFQRKEYPLKNILHDDLSGDFCNYDRNCQPNESSNDSWILFDFKQRKVDLYSYTIRANSGSEEWFHPKTWEILGSNNETQWTLLDHRENEDRVRGNSKMCNFSCQDAKHGRKECRFRYIKYHQIECWPKPNTNPFNIYINFFELFGNVFD